VATYLKSPVATSGVEQEAIRTKVSAIVKDIQEEGIAAVRRYSEQFDRWGPTAFRVSDEEIAAAERAVDDSLRSAIDHALAQVRRFAELQLATLTEFEVETLPGVRLGQKHIPIAAVGSYSPGGRYPLIASSIMTVAVPKVAGVPRVVACAPPSRGLGIDPAQLYAMVRSGADEVFCLGGVQALAAMALGVEGVAPVDMLVGAGNAYVAEAKRQLFGTVGIDLLAGPTEILIIADATADPELIAVDLLGQAEHGPTSPAIFLTTSPELAAEVGRAVERWLVTWPTRAVAEAAWRDCGQILLCESDHEMIEISDRMAPEHLEVQTADPRWFLDRLSAYGSLFLGDQTTVAYGDKGIGTNHVLPTGRAARYSGGLWVGKFLRTVTYQHATEQGTRQIAPTIAAICDAEGMAGHAISARVRLDPSTLRSPSPGITSDPSMPSSSSGGVWP
jgi:sulfopropanediol 3-dehydrogenase